MRRAVYTSTIASRITTSTILTTYIRPFIPTVGAKADECHNLSGKNGIYRIRKISTTSIGSSDTSPKDLANDASAPNTTLNSGITQTNTSSSFPPYKFETGHALFAKRSPRPFPPPFLSPPSGSFSEPLSTHNRSRDRRAFVNGTLIRGYTNGDDAVVATDGFLAVGDGVGAWAAREGGHAGLWSRLILHFWAEEVENESADRPAPQTEETDYHPDPRAQLQKAYERTIAATSEPNKWDGTTTATGAQLYCRKINPNSNSDTSIASSSQTHAPILYITNLGDSQVLVIRPSISDPLKRVLFKTTEQWHWFDCPRQLGTNSPDTPLNNASLDTLEIHEHDIILAMSDGVIDNLWEHEIVENVVQSIQKWEGGKVTGAESVKDRKGGKGGMGYVANELMHAARVIAQDPFAESPFMEHAVEEGLAMEGGKMDDISVVVAVCRRNDG